MTNEEISAVLMVAGAVRNEYRTYTDYGLGITEDDACFYKDFNLWDFYLGDELHPMHKNKQFVPAEEVNLGDLLAYIKTVRCL